jgi:ATP-dependent Clp protease ATP-binding subunit ClpC
MIPYEKVNTMDFSQNLRNLEQELAAMVFGQQPALDAIAKKIKSSFFFQSEKKRPIAVFLFLGPTGVGKTEVAKSLARIIFNSEENLIRIDMSEYFEKHQLARLIGAPPGYIGYDDDGQLTSAVRKKPFSIVLLDEVEKAHRDVLKIFLQVFDDGRLTDGKGRVTDFSNTIIIMTSNVGSQLFLAQSAEKKAIGFLEGEEEAPRVEPAVLFGVELKKHFLPEFLNRIDEVLCFSSLDRETLKKIACSKLEDAARSLLERKITLKWDESVLEAILAASNSAEFGAREILRTIEKLIKYPLIDFILEHNITGEKTILAAASGGKVTFRDS